MRCDSDEIYTAQAYARDASDRAQRAAADVAAENAALADRLRIVEAELRALREHVDRVATVLSARMERADASAGGV